MTSSNPELHRVRAYANIAIQNVRRIAAADITTVERVNELGRVREEIEEACSVILRKHAVVPKRRPHWRDL